MYVPKYDARRRSLLRTGATLLGTIGVPAVFSQAIAAATKPEAAIEPMEFFSTANVTPLTITFEVIDGIIKEIQGGNVPSGPAKALPASLTRVAPIELRNKPFRTVFSLPEGGEVYLTSFSRITELLFAFSECIWNGSSISGYAYWFPSHTHTLEMYGISYGDASGTFRFDRGLIFQGGAGTVKGRVRRIKNFNGTYAGLPSKIPLAMVEAIENGPREAGFRGLQLDLSYVSNRPEGGLVSADSFKNMAANRFSGGRYAGTLDIETLAGASRLDFGRRPDSIYLDPVGGLTSRPEVLQSTGRQSFDEFVRLPNKFLST